MEKYLNQIDKILEFLLDSKELLAEEKLKELKKTIIYDMALKNSNTVEKQQLKTAKEFLKNSAKSNEVRPLFHKMYKIDDTYQLCDGFVAIVLKNKIEGLEVNTAEGEYLDCRKVIHRDYNIMYNLEEIYSKEEIDLLELEQQATIVKRIKNLPLPDEVMQNKYRTYYNPLKLLTAIRILGTKNVEIYFPKNDSKAPIYCLSDLGEAIVLPVKMPTE